MSMDWTPEQIAAAREVWHSAPLDALADDVIPAMLSAVDLSDHDRAVAAPLLQAMHDARGILGFDLDGDQTPDAEIAGAGSVERYVEQFLADVREHREDYDEAVDEIPLDRDVEAHDRAVAADALRQAADAAADNCASVLNDDDPTEANRWADTEHWLRARAEGQVTDDETPAKDVRRSYRPCTCTDQQPSAHRLSCGCRACVTCGDYTEWAHDDSL